MRARARLRGALASLPSLRIISGGQTGVDRAALDVALELHIDCGGFCPRGRWAEDGRLDARYPLRETASTDPAERTQRNATESDATLVLYRGTPAGGTALAIECAEQVDRPVLRVDLTSCPDLEAARRWLRERGGRVLNVAGPRESESPGVYAAAADFLRRLLSTQPAASRDAPA